MFGNNNMYKYFTETYINAKYTQIQLLKATLYGSTTLKDVAIVYNTFYNEVLL